MPPLLIALQPSNELSKRIFELRKEISKITKEALISHDPHITLFVNNFDNFDLVEEELKRILKKCRPFTLNVEGTHLLEDPIFNGVTLVYTK